MALTTDFQPIAEGITGRRVGFDYEFRCSTVPVQFTLSHLSEARGELRAEVVVETVEDAATGKLLRLALRDRVALLSQRMKGGLAKAIEERIGISKTPSERAGQLAMWNRVIEAICNCVLEDVRQGEPVMILADVEAPDHVEYLVEKLLPLSCPVVLYGDGGSCKSLTALYLAIAVASKKDLPGLKMMQPPQPVLYLDWEAGPATHSMRLSKACAGLAIPTPRNIFYRRMTHGLADDLRRLREIVDRHGIGFIVADSMGAACAGEPEAADVVLRFFGALRELNSTAAVISHITKLDAQLPGTPRPYGNVATTNQARSTWFCRRSGPEDADYSKVSFTHTKVNDGKYFRPIGLRYDFLPDKTTIAQLDPALDYELSDNLPLSTRIAATLKGGAMTLKELAEELNAKEKSVDKTLRSMPGVQGMGGGRGAGNEKKWGLKGEEDISF